MDPMIAVAAISHNTAIELSSAKMTRELTVSEMLLHDQACRTLQGYLRLGGIEFDARADARLDELYHKNEGA